MKQVFIFVLLLTASTVHAQWIKQSVNTTASFRGLSVVNQNVVWASGTGGTVIRSIDAGKTWDVIVVPDAESRDFRDIEAFDENTAFILSIGNADFSRIYKTTDGGKTWKLQFTNSIERGFYDALSCWDAKHCIAMSDPVTGRYFLISTSDGETWAPLVINDMPVAKPGEAAFAASGTCLIVQGKNTVFLVSGGSDARIFKSTNRGKSWSSAATPIVSGTSGSGIFSIAMFDAKNGVIVGGNYEKPNEAKDNLAFTSDGGKTWKLGTGLTGYRSGVAYIDRKTLIAVGTNGTDISYDGGVTWKNVGKEDLNAVAAKGKKAVWAVGPKGLVVKLAASSVTKK